jgi:cold shock CspA family protein
MAEESFIGIVKWFNNKSGYGFINHQQEDIFVHYQQLVVPPNVYKYLVQGEYVTFKKKELTDNHHKCMASNVTGVGGGPLMCETRQKMKETTRDEPRVELS